MTKKSHKKFSYNYTTIRINGEYLEGARDPLDRLNFVPLDFSNKTVLDLGCNIGGMLFAISDKISAGYGYDVNSYAIEKANQIKEKYNLNHLEFTLADLENFEDLKLPRTDIVFMLSIAIWISNWKEILTCINPSTLLFESHGDEYKKKEQVEFLQNFFSDVIQIETAEGSYRNLYLCKK